MYEDLLLLIVRGDETVAFDTAKPLHRPHLAIGVHAISPPSMPSSRGNDFSGSPRPQRRGCVDVLALAVSCPGKALQVVKPASDLRSELAGIDFPAQLVQASPGFGRQSAGPVQSIQRGAGHIIGAAD